MIRKIKKSIWCMIGLHSWYYGNFQTGKRSDITGDHIGVFGRSCRDCSKKQKRKDGKYINVERWES